MDTKVFKDSEGLDSSVSQLLGEIENVLSSKFVVVLFIFI